MVRSIALGIALAFAYSAPATLVAQHSGGHGGGHAGGHSSGHSGGHGSSSHGGSHGSSGHASGTHGSGSGSSSHSSGSHGSSAGHATHRASSGTSGATSSSGTTPGARPREGRPIVGTAIPRTDASASTGRIPSVVTPFNSWPYYYNGGFRFSGLGLYRYPSLTGYGYWWPDDWYGYRWPAEAPPAAVAPDPFDRTGATGKLRLHVEPRSAQVFVDGYYAGIVDDFDGVFQRLTLTIGPHHVLIREPGSESLEFDVIIEPHHTTTYRGLLSR